MAQIQTSTFEPRQICVYPEIWDAKKLQLIPIKDMDSCSVHEVLDSIVLAVEAGAVDNFLWPQQIFASRNAFEDFIEQLREYDECYRITDQWWCALAALCEVTDEEAFVSSAEIADTLLGSAHEDGKIENFKRKVPKYKHSAKECIDAILALQKYAGAGYSDSVMPVDERVRVQDVSRFGRYYSEKATKTQLQAAFLEGATILKAQHAAAKAVKVKKAASTEKAPATSKTRKPSPRSMS